MEEYRARKLNDMNEAWLKEREITFQYQ